MILQQYIQEVLFKQRVCVVPQLGTFSVQHFPAVYDKEAQTLTAPREQVMFTRQWQDDGSCVEWIALKENLVPAVAQRKLEKYLEELKEGLKSGTPLVLPGIGQLQGDFAGNIHFHAEEPPLQKEALNIMPVERAGNTTASSAVPAEEPAPILEPIMTEEVEDTLEAVTAESGFKWWWAGIPIAMIIAGLATWWYLSSQTPGGPAATAAYTDTMAQQATTPADSLPPAADTAAVTPPAPAPVKYFVVVKQFADSSKAAAYQKQQKIWGREVVIYKKDSLYKTGVALSPAADTTNELNAVKKVFGNGVYLDFQ
jgi:hypothetical protein